jgi:hypothetical protein
VTSTKSTVFGVSACLLLAVSIVFARRQDHELSGLLLPLGIGAFTALAIAATGHGLGDTPIPFLVIVCTLVMIGGQGLRSRNVSPML